MKKISVQQWIGLFVIGFLVRLLLSVWGGLGHPTDQACFFYWAQQLPELGMGGFYRSVGFCDYPPGYFYLLYPIGLLINAFHMEYISAGGALLIRLPAIAADLVLAWMLGRVALRRRGERAGLAIAAAVLFCPLLILDSAVWAQIDSVWCLFLVLAILWRENRIKSAAMLAIAVLIKPQALLFFPMMALFYFDREHPVREYLKAILTGAVLFFVLTLPFCRGDYGLILQKYFGTMNEGYPYATVNAFNFYGLIGANWEPLESPFLLLNYRIWGYVMILVSQVVGALCLLKWKRSPWVSAAVMMTVMFLFGPMMHERYWFPAILLLAAAYADQPQENGRLLSAFVLAAGVNFLNVFLVLIYALRDYAEVPDTLILLSSLLTVAAGIRVFRTAKEEFRYDRTTKLQALWEKRRVRQQPILPRPEPKTGKRSLAILLAITVLYGALAFFRLGNTEAPQTFVPARRGELIRIDLGRECWPTRINVYAGISNNTSYRFYLSDTPQERGEEIGTLTSPYCFAWHPLDNGLTGRYLNIAVGGTEDGALGELILFDGESAEQIEFSPPDGWEYLADEQQLGVYTNDDQNGSYFDEIYHARTAYEFLHRMTPYETTHPPLGKDLIAIGIAMFGMTPFGWRFVGTLFGVLMLPLFFLLCKKIFRSEQAGLFGCALFALDFMHFSQTRIATIDTYALFFLLLMFLFMADYLQTHRFRSLAFCGIAFGLGAASKWTCLYAGAGLAVLFFVDLFLQRKERDFARTAWRRCLWCVLFFVLIPAAIYLLSYLPWTLCEGQSWETVWNNQFYMYRYHSGLQAEHPYSSFWYEWIGDVKPIVFYRETTMSGDVGAIASFGNPAIWWGGFVALLLTFWYGSKRRDRAAWWIWCGYLAALLPWVAVSRVVFIYHYFNCTPFLILAIVFVCSVWERKTPAVRVAKWGYVLLAAILFAVFYPVLSGVPMSEGYLRGLSWFPQWMFL